MYNKNMNSEFKRMMELAGLAEIKVNKPKTSFPGKKNPLIDYTAGDITSDDVDQFGDYDEASNTFKVEQGSDTMADFYDGVYKGTDMDWWEDDDAAEDLSDFYTYSLKKAIKEKYGDNVNIEYF